MLGLKSSTFYKLAQQIKYMFASAGLQYVVDRKSGFLLESLVVRKSNTLGLFSD